MIGSMLVIRLQRTGKKNSPSFRVVLIDARKGAKSGGFLEILGSYNPQIKGSFQVKEDRIKHWIKEGVQVSDTVHNHLIKTGVIAGDTHKVVSYNVTNPSTGSGPVPPKDAESNPSVGSGPDAKEEKPADDKKAEVVAEKTDSEESDTKSASEDKN
jgi:small subunit ribosomal protein S16